ncbi:ABC transporter ATP-binding protein [Pedobacter hiemivivus]|uniref:ABC transporter ATP-binding protein n=1 Tax=Pedobacter hiemivivus TaxID=2530454 RepID=A0A4U1GMK3_9SPHI|nr:ABC transporter ATP-binding protein [Pedobacter hiemivivus]TKC65661.1 ABC transporter ATP-binding protein [Pedobacter hiemivivus]
MNEPIVRVENLSHRYSVQWAVKDINFELSRQGIYGLLGANGAGKSTIMNIMCGVLKQTHGEIFIKGISLKENPVAAKRHIGFLPQQAPLQTDLTVEEYLTYCARLRLMQPNKISSAISEVMSKVGITQFQKRLIGNLSGGYQQRVGIAQAIIHKPDFVVLDEPTNGLDPNQILEVRKLIKEIAEERTVVLSTHILQEVQALCDNIWMINEGEVVFTGGMGDFDNYILPSTLILSLNAAPPIEELKAIPGILGIEILSPTQYRIQFSDAQEVTELIVAKSVQNNWRLSEIGVEKRSLEDVFSELSKKRNTSANFPIK